MFSRLGSLESKNEFLKPLQFHKVIKEIIKNSIVGDNKIPRNLETSKL